MKRLSLIVFVLAAACAPAAPPPPSAPPAADPAEVRRAIEASNARAVAAIVKGDAAAIFAASYADNAVLMMPNQPKAEGKDAITACFAGLLKEMSVKAAHFETDDVIVQGDVAIETGRVHMILQPKKGSEVTDAGKYLTVWKKQADGSWRIIRDISNSDGPTSK